MRTVAKVLQTRARLRAVSLFLEIIYHQPRFQRPPLYGQPRSQGLSSSPPRPLWSSRELGEARPWERGYYTVTVLGWCSRS